MGRCQWKEKRRDRGGKTDAENRGWKRRSKTAAGMDAGEPRGEAGEGSDVHAATLPNPGQVFPALHSRTRPARKADGNTGNLYRHAPTLRSVPTAAELRPCTGMLCVTVSELL